MYAAQPPAPPRKSSPLAIGIMIVATILYGFSVIPWIVSLVMSPMLYDSPDNASTATLLIIGLVGWPVAVLAGLAVGWWKRTVKVAAISAAAPLVWALVIVAGVEVVNPSFFNARDFLPETKVLKASDRELAGVALGADPDAVFAVLGAPEAASSQGKEMAPGEAVYATRTLESATWQYPGRGLTLHWFKGAVNEVTAEVGWKGETPRGLRVGDSMDHVTALYGDIGNVSTSIRPDGQSETHSFYGKGFKLFIAGDRSGRVESFSLQLER